MDLVAARGEMVSYYVVHQRLILRGGRKLMNSCFYEQRHQIPNSAARNYARQSSSQPSNQESQNPALIAAKLTANKSLDSDVDMG